MPDSSEQRRLLGAFLRARRAAVAPAAGATRRRTPGLRREEVAQSCGISTTWYTWMEQGRDIAVSAAALARLADALRLSAAERAYLFELAARRDPAPPSPDAPALPAELRQAVAAIAVPAYVLDRLWTAQAWNAAAGDLFAPWFDSAEPCLLRFVFLVPAARDFIFDWENRARRLAAELRADTAQGRDDPAVQALIAGLQHDSPEFARFWNDHAVLAREGGARRFIHPRSGDLRYEQLTLFPSTHPGCKLVMLLAAVGG